jgi:hypothetical protein
VVRLPTIASLLVTSHKVIEIIAGRIQGIREFGTRFDIDDRTSIPRERSSNRAGAIGYLKLVDSSDDGERLRVVARAQGELARSSGQDESPEVVVRLPHRVPSVLY